MGFHVYIKKINKYRPIGDDSGLNGVLQDQGTSLAPVLVSYVRVLLSLSDHDTLMAWRPTIERKTAGGASPRANPALRIPKPFPTTRAASFRHTFSLEHG